MNTNKKIVLFILFIRTGTRIMDHSAIIDRLIRDVSTLQFRPPVTHVYNPLVYARKPYEMYLSRYASAPREVLLLGMNPGPWGMAQTGVPFGEVTLVQEWLEIEGPVETPPNEHPKRPVTGFSCRRSEVSGRRLWGWAKKRFKTPEAFFSRFFVANYCPLVFMEESGKNKTPASLSRRAEIQRQFFYDQTQLCYWMGKKILYVSLPVYYCVLWNGIHVCGVCSLGF